jgi:hypothetical protein
MQSWKNSKFASSLRNLWSEAANEREMDSRLEAVRGAMLEELFNALDARAHRTILFVKLKGAAEIQTLWFLRSDLMQVLSEHLGESEAMQRLDGLTRLFHGIVPKPQLQSALRRR